MEKQQIIEAIAEANKSNNRNVSLNSEQYYKEIFKKEKRVIPRIPPEQRVKLNEGVEPKIKKDNKNKCFECNEDKNENELYCSFCRSQI